MFQSMHIAEVLGLAPQKWKKQAEFS